MRIEIQQAVEAKGERLSEVPSGSLVKTSSDKFYFVQGNTALCFAEDDGELQVYPNECYIDNHNEADNVRVTQLPKGTTVTLTL